MHTEKEAELLWCPHVKIVHRSSLAMQGPSGPMPAGIATATTNMEPSKIKQGSLTRHGEHTTCIGSKCSQWRWAKEEASIERRGYCGLAGQP